MVILRQIAGKISVNSYKISSYKSCFFVKILLIIKWLIFNSFGKCDQIGLAADQYAPLQLVFPEQPKKFTPGIPWQIRSENKTIQAAVNAKPNWLPSPNWLLTQIFPPWASINSFEIDNPSPVPLRSCVPGTLK
jgi:hypothetical protein